MLLTYLSTGFSILALLCAGWALYVGLAAVRFVRENEPQRLNDGRLTKIETEMTEIVDSTEALRVSLRKLRARITMRTHRVNGKAGEPDPRSDPAAYKAHMRLKLLRK